MTIEGIVEGVSMAPAEATGPGKPRAVISTIVFQTPIGSAQFMVLANWPLGSRVKITVDLEKPAGLGVINRLT